jgi:CRP/FNR family transcriptional regulator, cyclic AMP receptor protein
MPPTLDTLSSLQVNPWFAALPSDLQRALVELAEPVHLSPGEMLFRQGDPVSGGRGAFFGLLSGQIKISSLRDDGHEAILAVLEAGNWFGEISLFDQRPRTHDATALGPVAVLALPQTAFEALLDSAEGFGRAMCGLLAGRVRSLYGMVEDATLRSTRARVARRLVLLAHGDATQANTARPVVNVSQDALAMMLGITRQTLNKELKALAALGALVPRYGRIEITAIAVLAEQGEVSLVGNSGA